LIVLDASLMVEWLIGRNGRSAFPNIYDALSNIPVLVPSHWPLEIGNALRPELRHQRMSATEFHSIMGEFDSVDIRVQSVINLDEIGPLALFAAAHDLTTYDATYVQLALSRGAILATLDRAMRTSATKLNIPLLPA
jgi:predicted nucleic acid-binding protein